MDQLVSIPDMILPIKNVADWKLIRKQKQTHINYDNSCKKMIRVN